MSQSCPVQTNMKPKKPIREEWGPPFGFHLVPYQSTWKQPLLYKQALRSLRSRGENDRLRGVQLLLVSAVQCQDFVPLRQCPAYPGANTCAISFWGHTKGHFRSKLGRRSKPCLCLGKKRVDVWPNPPMWKCTGFCMPFSSRHTRTHTTIAHAAGPGPELAVCMLKRGCCWTHSYFK